MEQKTEQTQPDVAAQIKAYDEKIAQLEQRLQTISEVKAAQQPTFPPEPTAQDELNERGRKLWGPKWRD